MTTHHPPISAKHPMEDLASWELFQERELAEEDRRRVLLEEEEAEENVGDDTLEFSSTISSSSRRLHRHSRPEYSVDTKEKSGAKKDGKEEEDPAPTTDNTNNNNFNGVGVVGTEDPTGAIPDVAWNTTHVLMIDAGSQGTRIHLYEFERRLLDSHKEISKALNGFKLSIPTTNTRWTNRHKPGLDLLASILDDKLLQTALQNYFDPLFHFPKTVLSEKQPEWYRYPIYLKATGGLRTLPTQDRLRLVEAVRILFSNTTFNPFHFADIEQVRVISGEEEAIYGWAAVNFAMGTLVKDTEGTGTVLNPQRTWGVMEMGGASTQIAFFQNNQDVMANLIKLQIGGARHWNVYAHSFLYFGINGAWDRLNAQLYFANGGNNNKGTTAVNPCLPQHSNTTFTSWIHYNEQGGYLLPRSDNRSTVYSTVMTNDEYDFNECTRITRALLRKEANTEWVDFSHDGDCSFAGVYQPPLLTNTKETTKHPELNQFILTSNFNAIWNFLQLINPSTVEQLGQAAQMICSMDATQLRLYNSVLQSPVDHDHELFQYCFRSVFAFEMLHTGYGFPLDFSIVAGDVVNGQKLGWALGSTLYEINTMPWEFGPNMKIKEFEPHHHRHHHHQTNDKKHSHEHPRLAQHDKSKKHQPKHPHQHHHHSKHHPHKKHSHKNRFSLLGWALPPTTSSDEPSVSHHGDEEWMYLACAIGVGFVLTSFAAWVMKRRRHLSVRHNYEEIPSAM
jgi:Golgi nucleoside diphosphatase